MMNRRDFLSGGVVAMAAVAVGLPGCGTGEETDAVHVLVVARVQGFETVEAVRNRVFSTVQIPDIANLRAKLGWIMWSGETDADIVVLDEEVTVSQADFATTEDPDDPGNTELPWEETLYTGDAIAFFLLDCGTIATAEGGEPFATLVAGVTNFEEVVVLRDGRVLEGVNLAYDVAEPGDEVVIFYGGKIAA